jgi:DNA-binding LacI/PurR family transcriptional regulator
MASIRDVAKLAGVSVSTVSRVLGDSPKVEPETRRRVEQAIETIGYRPNLLAQGLRSKSSNLLGLVVPEIRHETFASFIEYIEEEAAARGYILVTGNTHGRPEVEAAFIDILMRRHVDGIIFSRVSDRSQVLNIVAKGNTPAVIIDRCLDHEDIPVISMNNYLAGRMAAEHLADLGHRSFAVITGPQNISLCRERLKGFAEHLEQRGLLLPRRNIFEGDFKYESGVEAAKYLLENGVLFSSLWAENDLMAVGAMNTFIRAGKHVPEDISVMGMDDTTSSKMVIPTLTTIRQPFEAMCKKAVELIISMKTGEVYEERRFVLPPSIVIRESTSYFS